MANDGGLSSLICFGYLIVSFRECDGIFLWPTAFRAADTLIETAKMNGVNPEAWLAWVRERIQDHPAQHITELMPWAYQESAKIKMPRSRQKTQLNQGSVYVYCKPKGEE